MMRSFNISIISIATALLALSCGKSSKSSDDGPRPEDSAALSGGNEQLGQPIEINKTYKAKERIYSPEAGISVQIPNGFNGIQNAVDSGLILSSADGSSTMGFLITVVEGNEAFLKKECGQSQALDQGVVLAPSGEPDIEGGNRFICQFRNQQMNLSLLIGGRTGGFGYALIVARRGYHDITDEEQQLIGQILGDTLFVQPKKAETPPPSDNSSQEFPIVGRKLTYYKTNSTGYSEEEHIWLCADSRFFRTFNSSSSGISSGSYYSSSKGTYRLEGSLLVLTDSEQNTEASYQLKYEGTKLYANGQRYFVTDEMARCQ